MRKGVITAALCLITLLAELAFDSSTAFVRTDVGVAKIANNSPQHDGGAQHAGSSGDSKGCSVYNANSHFADSATTLPFLAPMSFISCLIIGLRSVVEEGFISVPLRPPIA